MSSEPAKTGTQFPDFFAALADTFDEDEVKTRAQAGRQFSYVTARTVMNRLDNVAGPECWWDEYVPLEHSVICKLTIRLPDGAVLTKSDAGGYAGMADPGDDDKSGYTDAFKRAAVKFGVGRYLYRDGVPEFARGELARMSSDRPSRPSNPAPAQQQRQQAPSQQNGSSDRGAPTNGRALFAWTKDQDEKNNYGMLNHLNAWAKRQDFPQRMVDWETDQVNRAYSEGCRKIRAIGSMQATAAALDNGDLDNSPAPQPQSNPDAVPRDGRGLWTWCLAQKRTDPTIIDTVNNVIKAEIGESRMVDLNPNQVAMIFKIVDENARRSEVTSRFKPSPQPTAAPARETRDHVPVPDDGDQTPEDDIPF